MARKTSEFYSVTIEFPSQGTTYSRPEYGVYGYGEYPDYSVLAGQERRVFLGSYETLEAAKAAHPEAKWTGLGSAPGYTEDLVPLEELEDEDLQAIVKMAKTGGNELAQREAREAQNILDNRAEAAYERSLSDYYGGGSPQTMQERHEAAWAEHREAHKR